MPAPASNESTARSSRSIRSPRSPVARAAAWMVGALFSFLAMALAGRELSAGGLGTFQILLFRSVVGLVVVGLLAARASVVDATGAAPVWRTQRLGLHTLRNVAHFGGQFGWFFALGAIPLAEVFAIEFTVPIWTALLAAAFLGERLGPARIAALALGLAGVVTILRPGQGLVHPAALAALGGAVAYAVSHLQTKRLTTTESPLAVLFWMTLIQLPLGAVGAALQWQPLHLTHSPALLVVGLSALAAHYCLTRALTLADVGLVLPMDYLRLPLVGLIGYLGYGERLDAWAVLGTVLILSGNALNLRAGSRPAVR
jgi:drug/metabolite transporter (DMT)-like permease